MTFVEFLFQIKLFVCNVDTDAESYIEAKNLSSIVEVVNRFNKTSPSILHVLEKEKQDYVFCIRESLKLEPRYSLIIEDDAIPRDDFFRVVHDVIQRQLDMRTRFGELETVNEALLYVKLYHPERLLGYLNIEPDRLPELFGIGFLFGTLMMLVYKKLVISEHSISIFHERLVFCVLCVFVMLVVICIGRPHVVEFRRFFSLYSFMKAPECCTPAMLFPNQGAKLVADFLANTTCRRQFGKDMALEKFRHSKVDFKTYMVQPNLVTHIGMYSSLRRAVLDPFIV